MRVVVTALLSVFLLANGPALAATPAKPGAKLPAAVSPAILLPEASEEQLAAAQRPYYGDYACEFNQTVKVVPSVAHPGYVDVSWKNAVFTTKPVISPTGAVRLEDVRGRGLMIQIATKSMLMDAVEGRRLVDDCVHETQRLARAQTSPAGQGLGIDPTKTAGR